MRDGVSSPSAPPGQCRSWRAAAASLFVSPAPSSCLICGRLFRPPPPSSSLSLTPPSLLCLPSPRSPAFPKLSGAIHPPGPQLRRVPCALPAPSPALSGLLMPKPGGRILAGLRIPYPGRAGLGHFIILSAAGSSAPTPLPPPRPRLAGPSVRRGAEDPLPALFFQTPGPPGVQPRGLHPQGYRLGREGISRGEQSRKGLSLEGCREGYGVP